MSDRRPTGLIEIQDYKSKERTFLEARGWHYLGSLAGTVFDGGVTVAIHYYQLGKSVRTQKEAMRAESKMDIGTKWKASNAPMDIRIQDIPDWKKVRLWWRRLNLCIRCGSARHEDSRAFCLNHLVQHREKARKENGYIARNSSSTSYRAERKKNKGI